MMRRSTILWASAILRAIVSAIYWSVVTVMAYASTGGSPAPGTAPPSPVDQYGRLALIGIVAVLVYASVSMAWRRLEDRTPR